VTAPWRPEEERALTARSVVASTLLGVRPPHLPTRQLVDACALFGISDGTARVAISRMVAAGELAPDDGGYGLTGPLLDRSARQDLSAEAATRPWSPADGWTMAVVVGEARAAAERSALRRAAAALRLSERREGVWLRPDNLPAGALPEAEAVVDAQCERFTAHPTGDAVALAAGLWDLAGWAARAERLLDALDRTRPTLAAGDRRALPEAFVLSAAVLRHLQADPLLPDDLLPEHWPGAALRVVHRDWRHAFDRTWAAWARGPDPEMSGTT
jgi:phenylacetic acid degradation operon negative regulatory protein